MRISMPKKVSRISRRVTDGHALNSTQDPAWYARVNRQPTQERKPKVLNMGDVYIIADKIAME